MGRWKVDVNDRGLETLKYERSVAGKKTSNDRPLNVDVTAGKLSKRDQDYGIRRADTVECKAADRAQRHVDAERDDEAALVERRERGRQRRAEAAAARALRRQARGNQA
jgi:hypothetical protein